MQYRLAGSVPCVSAARSSVLRAGDSAMRSNGLCASRRLLSFDHRNAKPGSPGAAPRGRARPIKSSAQPKAPSARLATANSSRPALSASSSSNGSGTTQSKKAAATTMKGRFNRVAAEKGLCFAFLLYILGEGMTTTLTLCFHWGLFGAVVNLRFWLALLLGDRSKTEKIAAAAEGAETNGKKVGGGEEGREEAIAAPSSSWLSWLEAGPMLWEGGDLRLSAILVLHYGLANLLLHPAYPYQMAFCERVFPALQRVGRLFRFRKAAPATPIPKAPTM